LKTVVANGVALNVLEMGPPTSRRPPVVMLHGLLIGSIASWYFTCAPALARERRVILFDLRGHGRSARPDSGYDVATMAGDLRGLIDALLPGGAPPPDLVGHSWGALVAIEFALSHPERVGKLALVEAPLETAESDALTSVLTSSEDVGAELLAALPPNVRSDFDPNRRRGRRRLETLARLATETTLLADIQARVVPDDATLARLTAPVLALVGDESPCRESAARLCRVLPRARRITLRGGHFLPLTAPQAVSAALLEFLDG
jgi:pimeloyl-ACP methyl ester carboxylesterase